MTGDFYIIRVSISLLPYEKVISEILPYSAELPERLKVTV